MKILFSILIALCCASAVCRADESKNLGAKGIAEFQKGDYSHAIESFSRAIQLNTNYLGAYYYRGLSYMGTTEYPKAITDFSRALALNTNYNDAYYFRGVCYMNEEQYDRSITDFTRSLSLQTNIAVLMLRGYVYSLVTNDNRSIEDYNEVVRLAPSNPRGYIGRARVFILEGSYGLGILDCETALSLNPDLPGAYQELGEAYKGEGDNKEAIADFDRAIELDPDDPIAYYARAMVLVDTKNYAKAIPDLDVFLAAYPHDASAYSYRGWCRSETGNYRGALEDYERSISMDPASPWGYNNFAWLLAVCPEAKFRNGAKAVKYATKACELSQWKDASCIDTLAAAYAENGNFKEAIKWEEQALGGLSDEDQSEGKKALGLYQRGLPYHEMPK